MIIFQERYLVDAQDQRQGVFLDMADYQKVWDALAELESLHKIPKVGVAVSGGQTPFNLSTIQALPLLTRELIFKKLTHLTQEVVRN